MTRIDIINALIGRPYQLGAQGPDAFDCYAVTRLLQRELFGREMPEFSMPAASGRLAIASAIAMHPERGRWRRVEQPVDGAIVTMARNICGYHMGTWLTEEAGMIVHTVEGCGVTVDTIPALEALGWRKFQFHIPEAA